MNKESEQNRVYFRGHRLGRREAFIKEGAAVLITDSRVVQTDRSTHRSILPLLVDKAKSEPTTASNPKKRAQQEGGAEVENARLLEVRSSGEHTRKDRIKPDPKRREASSKAARAARKREDRKEMLRKAREQCNKQHNDSPPKVAERFLPKGVPTPNSNTQATSQQTSSLPDLRVKRAEVSYGKSAQTEPARTLRRTLRRKNGFFEDIREAQQKLSWEKLPRIKTPAASRNDLFSRKRLAWSEK